MSAKSINAKSAQKKIRFPLGLLAEIETSIESENAGNNFSSWVLEACKHRLQPKVTAVQTEIKPVRGVLTAQKKRFADYLMKGLNQTEAAILAGYGEKSARSKGSQLAKEPCVLDYIASKK